MPLLDLDTVKRQLKVTSTTDDGDIAIYIDAATAVVERHTGNLTSNASFTITDLFCYPVAVPNHPVTGVTSATDSDGNTVDVTGWTFTTNTITATTAGYFTVTYQAGYATAPANYELAGMIIVQHLWETRRGNMPNAGAVIEDPYSSAGIPRTAFGFAIPHKALELLGAESPLGFA